MKRERKFRFDVSEFVLRNKKTLSLVLIQCLVKKYGNDMELGMEIRKIFNELKS